MSDDLVRRLRDVRAGNAVNVACQLDDLCLESATALEEAHAEIERLRADLGTMDANHRQMAKTMADLARKHDTLRSRVREVVGLFISADLADCKDCTDNDGKHYQSQWLADAIRAARQLMEEVK